MPCTAKYIFYSSSFFVIYSINKLDYCFYSWWRTNFSFRFKWSVLNMYYETTLSKIASAIVWQEHAVTKLEVCLIFPALVYLAYFIKKYKTRPLAMLNYISTWEFASKLEKCREALSCASCYSTLLSCTYKFPRASITQHSTRPRFIFQSRGGVTSGWAY